MENGLAKKSRSSLPRSRPSGSTRPTAYAGKGNNLSPQALPTPESPSTQALAGSPSRVPLQEGSLTIPSPISPTQYQSTVQSTSQGAEKQSNSQSNIASTLEREPLSSPRTAAQPSTKQAAMSPPVERKTSKTKDHTQQTIRDKRRAEELNDPTKGVQASNPCLRCQHLGRAEQCRVARNPIEFGSFKCGPCIR
ncbi:hypothetical protein F4809DRAFT_607526 [Biscogniauxia mediterranea]|nr:hypothetical protein F4809DRAFT_607526 [Biscogniauxia mediterranea]